MGNTATGVYKRDTVADLLNSGPRTNMSYLSGILLLASVLALGQAAPVSNANAQIYGPLDQGPFNKLRELAKKQWSVSFPLVDELAKQESVYPPFKKLSELAKKQWSVSFPLVSELAKQENVDPGDLFRALGGLVDTFNQPRANAENSFDYGDAARAVGGLLDAFHRQQANQEAVANKETEANAEDIPWGALLSGAGYLLGG